MIEGVAILTPIVDGDAAQGSVDLFSIDFEKIDQVWDFVLQRYSGENFQATGSA